MSEQLQSIPASGIEQAPQTKEEAMLQTMERIANILEQGLRSYLILSRIELAQNGINIPDSLKDDSQTQVEQ